MAKVHGPFKVSGKIGDFIFYNSGGHNIIRQAPWPKKTTGNYYKEYPLLFLNRYVFAGAIEASRQIYHSFHRDFKRVARPHSHNLLRGRLRQMHHISPDQWTYDFPTVHLALHQLDLAPDNGSSSMLVTRLIGPSHQPTHIHLDNLRDIAQHIRRQVNLHGNAELHMRIQLCWRSYSQVRFLHDTREWIKDHDETPTLLYHSSRWIPDHLLPEQGLTLSARPKEGLPEDLPVFLCLLVEWREYRPVGDHTIPLSGHAILRILTCQYSPDLQPEIDRLTAHQATSTIPKPTPEETATSMEEAFEGLV